MNSTLEVTWIFGCHLFVKNIFNFSIQTEPLARKSGSAWCEINYNIEKQHLAGNILQRSAFRGVFYGLAISHRASNSTKWVQSTIKGWNRPRQLMVNILQASIHPFERSTEAKTSRISQKRYKVVFQQHNVHLHEAELVKETLEALRWNI